MAGRVSFIIPTLNEAGGIGELLRLLEASCPDCERIIVDGGSSDGTVKCAMPLCHQLLISPPGRARQMSLGAEVAQGDYLFFLHADTRPAFNAGVLAGVLAAEPAWGFSPVRLSGDRRAFRVIEWFINHRSRLTRVATGDQLIFVSRGTFEQAGGFDDIELMEDIALSKRLRALAAPTILPQAVVTSSRRWEQGGVVRTVLRMWWLRFAYFCGASPRALRRQYDGR